VTDKLAEFDWAKTTYVFTPSLSFADYRDLNQLEKGTVSTKIQWVDAKRATVTLVNTGKTVAFMVHARLVKPRTDEELAPVLWSDNFVSLLPGESRMLKVELPSGNKETEIHVDGWNVALSKVKATTSLEKK
jgi:exo-1,4-beta-D-glucosaminidase